jgi:hypothetical protein
MRQGYPLGERDFGLILWAATQSTVLDTSQQLAVVRALLACSTQPAEVLQQSVGGCVLKGSRRLCVLAMDPATKGIWAAHRLLSRPADLQLALHVALQRAAGLGRGELVGLLIDAGASQSYMYQHHIPDLAQVAAASGSTSVLSQLAGRGWLGGFHWGRGLRAAGAAGQLTACQWLHTHWPAGLLGGADYSDAAGDALLGGHLATCVYLASNMPGDAHEVQQCVHGLVQLQQCNLVRCGVSLQLLVGRLAATAAEAGNAVMISALQQQGFSS